MSNAILQGVVTLIRSVEPFVTGIKTLLTKNSLDHLIELKKQESSLIALKKDL